MLEPVFDFAEQPVLETARCHLRPMTPADAHALVALYTDPQVLEFIMLEPYPCGTPGEALHIINWMNEMFANKEAARWAITLHDAPDQLIGTIGFHFYSRRDRRVDIGYDLMSAYWGRGIMTEVTHTVVRWCFGNLSLHRIQADCTDGNRGSESVLLKVGFSVEGLWRESTFEHGRFVNIKQFGLLRREYLGEDA